ncbi:MAG: hypothetical protein WB952_20185 [Terriglobales bacterium]
MLALLACDDTQGLIRQFQRKHSRVYVFAGAVRDVLTWQEHGGEACLPRDLDVGVSGLPKVDFDRIMTEAGAVPNRFGGYRVRLHNTPAWDVWRLEDTIGLKLTGTRFSLENVLRSFVLDCNAIAFDIDTGEFLHLGGLKSIRQKRVDIARDAIFHSRATFAAKAVMLELKHALSLSPGLRIFVKHHLERNTLLHEARKSFSSEELPTQLLMLRVLNGARRLNHSDR